MRKFFLIVIVTNFVFAICNMILAIYLKSSYHLILCILQGLTAIFLFRRH